MKIVTYNMQFGLGKDGQFDLERIAEDVAGADIIALQEVERNWRRSGDVDQPVKLGEILDQYYWVYGPYFDVDASVLRPDGTVENIRRQFGNMILSKTPIVSSRLFPLPKSALRHRHNMVVGVFEGIVELPQDGTLRVYNTHLGAGSSHDRIKQINSMRDTVRRAPSEGGAWTGEHASLLWKEETTPPPMPRSFVLLGDFNLEAKDSEYDHLVGPMDGDLGRHSTEEEFLDTWVAAGHDEDAGATFIDDDGRGMRIDFAFVDQFMKERVLGAWIDEKAQGSDHQPYWVELDYAPYD